MGSTMDLYNVEVLIEVIQNLLELFFGHVFYSLYIHLILSVQEIGRWPVLEML